MFDQQHRHAALVACVQHEARHVFLLFLVHAGHGLVQDQEAGLGHQRARLGGLLHQAAGREVAQQREVQRAVGQEGKRAVLAPALTGVGGAAGVAHAGDDRRRELAAQRRLKRGAHRVWYRMVAAHEAATADVADALVPGGLRRQPHLDADAGRGAARVCRPGVARAHEQLHQAQVGGQGAGEEPHPAVEVEQVLPGLRRESAAHGLDERVGRAWQPRVQSPIDWDAVMFVPGTHLGITHHPVTVDNILYLLLERPID